MYRKLCMALILGCVLAIGCSSTKTFSRGDKMMYEGKYAEAIESYDKCLKHTDNYYAFLNKGIAEWRLKEYQKALQSFSDAIKAKPGNASLAFYYRAEIEFKTDKISDAFHDVNKSIEQDPLNVQALNLRGRIHTVEKRFKAAVNDFTAAIGIEGESTISGFLYHNRAIVHIAMDNFTSAIYDYEQYIKFLRKHNLPVTVEDNYLLGVLQYASGNRDEAYASWENIPSGEKAKIKNIIGNF